MNRLLGTLLLLTAAPVAEAQDLAERIAAAPDGRVRISYEAREGVCGNGRNVRIHSRAEEDEEWEWRCEPGPVRVLLRVRNGKPEGIDTYVGGNWRDTRRPVTDLGEVAAGEASGYLLALARDADFRDAEDAIYPAVIAAGAVVWPDLLQMARNRGLAEDVRSQAIFWLGQEATHQATSGLEEILDDDDEDIRIREHAVFAISQQDEDTAIPILIRVATTHRHPQIREQALFWLADSGDARAIDLFERILSGG